MQEPDSAGAGLFYACNLVLPDARSNCTMQCSDLARDQNPKKED